MAVLADGGADRLAEFLLADHPALAPLVEHLHVRRTLRLPADLGLPVDRRSTGRCGHAGRARRAIARLADSLDQLLEWSGADAEAHLAAIVVGLQREQTGEPALRDDEGLAGAREAQRRAQVCLGRLGNVVDRALADALGGLHRNRERVLAAGVPELHLEALA